MSTPHFHYINMETKTKLEWPNYCHPHNCKPHLLTVYNTWKPFLGLTATTHTGRDQVCTQSPIIALDRKRHDYWLNDQRQENYECGVCEYACMPVWASLSAALHVRTWSVTAFRYTYQLPLLSCHHHPFIAAEAPPVTVNYFPLLGCFVLFFLHVSILKLQHKTGNLLTLSQTVLACSKGG